MCLGSRARVSRSQVSHQHARLLGSLFEVRGAEQQEPVRATHHTRGLVAALHALAPCTSAARVVVHLVAVDVADVSRVPGACAQCVYTVHMHDVRRVPVAEACSVHHGI